MSRFCGIFLAALCVAGCGPAVQYASPTVQAEALSFTPAAGKSRIYVYRGGGFVGSAVSLKVAVDSQVVGATDPNSFLMVEVDPGAHLVSSPTSENEAFVKLDAAPDSCYFVKMWSKMGIMAAHSGMELSQPDSARKAIRKSQMAQSSWPGVPMPKAEPEVKNPSPMAP
jgi:hypothetical protein